MVVAFYHSDLRLLFINAKFEIGTFTAVCLSIDVCLFLNALVVVEYYSKSKLIVTRQCTACLTIFQDAWMCTTVGTLSTFSAAWSEFED